MRPRPRKNEMWRWTGPRSKHRKQMRSHFRRMFHALQKARMYYRMDKTKRIWYMWGGRPVRYKREYATI